VQEADCHDNSECDIASYSLVISFQSFSHDLSSAILQVNYFPSRHDPVRHAERVPIPTANLSACREKVSFDKFLNMKIQDVL